MIIGGGAAGISAAIWCADLGMTSLILEREEELYGQLRWINGPIRNYPGVNVRNGAELIELFDRSVAECGVKTVTGISVEFVDCAAKTVRLGDGRVYVGEAIFIATGIRRRTLGVKGESEFKGKGILLSGAGERESVKGKRVVVVGGGDAAAENALLLSEHAERVYLIHRRDTLSARNEFQDRVFSTPNIELVLESEVVKIGGTDRIKWIDIKSRTGEHSRIEAEHFIARVGVTPNSELFTPQLSTDDHGYILVDNLGRTNIGGVYAIGDVANPTSPTIATAVGMGATAAKSAFSLLTSKKTV